MIKNIIVILAFILIAIGVIGLTNNIFWGILILGVTFFFYAVALVLKDNGEV